MKWLAQVFLALALCAMPGGCAVKGYDLGWHTDDALAASFGEPLDALSGCRFERAQQGRPICTELVAELDAALADLPGRPVAPSTLGFSCHGQRCTYANQWERRDIGAAAVIPVYRKVVLREVRLAAERGDDGVWRVSALSVRDLTGPSYGPVRIGGMPVNN
ncbi:MAG: hypothetical protein AAF674_21700 [Pseudomonadota bacterium]